MPAVQFYFELVSPYSYVASLKIDRLIAASGVAVQWRPIELGEVWRTHGVFDAYQQIRSLKAPYIFCDAVRSAKAEGITMEIPKTKTSAPDTLLAKLAYWGLQQDDPQRAKRFLQAVWHRYFGEGKSIGNVSDLALAAAEIGLTAKEIKTASELPAARIAQDASNRDAVASGCFGVPWFIADGECFFGQDRLSQLAACMTQP
jgi:2-hydroxychromene-2-carboxylate isomerase